MDDQRVEARPGFRGEDVGDGTVVCRVASDSVHGFGRKGDESAGAQQACRAQDRIFVGGDEFDCRRPEFPVLGLTRAAAGLRIDAHPAGAVLVELDLGDHWARRPSFEP